MRKLGLGLGYLGMFFVTAATDLEVGSSTIIGIVWIISIGAVSFFDGSSFAMKECPTYDPSYNASSCSKYIAGLDRWSYLVSGLV